MTAMPHEHLWSYLVYAQGGGGGGCSWTVQKAQSWLNTCVKAPLTWPGGDESVMAALRLTLSVSKWCNVKEHFGDGVG